MTRPHTPQLEEILHGGSFSRRLEADVLHGTDRVLQNLSLTDWSLSGDLSSEVKHSGSATIVYQSENGESVSPQGTKGVLSPFRAHLYLTMVIEAEESLFSERVGLGEYRIDGVPWFRDATSNVNGVERTITSDVRVNLVSIDDDVRRWGFPFPTHPKSYTSCYAELRRITGRPVTETLPDKAIPANTVWEATSGGRLKAAHTLASILGGVLVPNSDGALIVIPDQWTAEGAPLIVGERGTVVDIGDSLDTEEIYNEIVGTFQTDERAPITSVARITEGDLAVDGLYRPHTRYYSNPLVKTQSAADSTTKSLLSSSLGGQAYEVPVQCVLDPTRELGDVVPVEGHSRDLTGRIIKYTLSDSPLMNVTLEAKRDLL